MTDGPWDDIDWFDYDGDDDGWEDGRTTFERHYAWCWDDAQRRMRNLELYGQMDTPPVQTCRWIGPTAPQRPSSLSMFDQCLKDIYAPALRDHINNSRPFFDMLVTNPTPFRKRVWWKPSTWRKKKLTGLKALLKQDTRKVVWKTHTVPVKVDGLVGDLDGIPVVEDPLCPPNMAYLINTDALSHEPSSFWQSMTDASQSTPLTLEMLEAGRDNMARITSYEPYSFKMHGTPPKAKVTISEPEEENRVIAWHIEGDDEDHPL